MNIHFDDKELFEKLKSATLAKVVVGSRLYGNHNDDLKKGPISDTDFLYIYATSFNEVNSFISTHHQLQFKENNVDYNFVSLHTFIKNILNGDSTINFEVIQSDVLNNTDLEWLVKHRDSFVTYSVIRSYLGLSRRDIKHYHKANTEYDKKKKLGHIWRGYMYANNMIHHTWNFKNVNEQFCKKYDLLDVSNNKSLRDVESGISFMRDLLNEKFGDKTLGYAQHMKVEDATLLMDNFLKFCKTDIFVNKQNILQDFDMSRFVNSFENWVEY